MVGFFLSAQSNISGTVKDNDGMPVPGANIILEGTSKGAVTDIDGKYSVSNIENGTYTMVASYLGYSESRKSITVDGTDLTVDFVLAEDTESLDQVIVTGVTNPKSKIESSVSVTTMRPSVIKQSAPRTTGEIFRTIPGIRSESSGGEGNSNIAVRGVPVSSGGFKICTATRRRFTSIIIWRYVFCNGRYFYKI